MKKTILSTIVILSAVTFGYLSAIVLNQDAINEHNFRTVLDKKSIQSYGMPHSAYSHYALREYNKERTKRIAELMDILKAKKVTFHNGGKEKIFKEIDLAVIHEVLPKFEADIIKHSFKQAKLD